MGGDVARSQRVSSIGIVASMAAETSADSTRDRIVEAATVEFARHGIAGARIARIAESARTSKERVYAHFRGKDALYRHVADRELAAVAAATGLDASDLPAYAGRVHDYFLARPAARRLMRWGELELPAASDGGPDDAGVRELPATVTDKVEEIRRAQRAGQLDPSWDPMDVLVLVNQVTTAWVDHPGLAPAGGPERERYLAERRAAVVAAVARLFPAAKDRWAGRR